MKWNDYHEDEATWEQDADFIRDFSTFVIESNDTFKRGGYL